MRIYALQATETEPRLINATLLKALKPHTTPVISATVDITGTLIATGGADGIVKVWDIRGGYITHTLRGHGGVISALHFFETTSAEPFPKPKSNKRKRQGTDLEAGIEDVNGHDPVKAYCLASGGEDGKIRIWDLSKRKSIAMLDSHVSVVRGFDYSAAGNTFISASRDKTIITWNAGTWQPRRVIPVLEAVEAVGFAADGILCYTGGENGLLRIWNLELGSEITKEQKVRDNENAITHMTRNVRQDMILSVHEDQSLILHSSAGLSSIPAAKRNIDPLPVIRRISGTHDEIIDLAFVGPDRSLLALATNLEDVRLVTLARSAAKADAKTAVYFGADVASLQGHSDIIICLTVDHSGYWLATGAKDNTARLWRIDHSSGTYEHYATFTGHAESIGAIALPSAPQSSTSAATKDPSKSPPPLLMTGSEDRTVKRWNIAKTAAMPAKAQYTRKAHDKDINSLALSPSSHLFASASQDRTVKIWSTEEGEIQGVLRGHKRGVWSVAFAPKDIPSLGGENISASSSRGLILTGSGDKSVKIWSLNDYSCLRTFEGHTNSVHKVVWLPVASLSSESITPSKRPAQIASAGGDGLVKVWDTSTGEVETTLDNHTDRIWALTVDPTTRTIVSGGGDSVVTFWKDTSSATTAATKKAKSERVEQDQSLQNYIHAGNYREAITLALALNHPARLLNIFESVLSTSPPEPDSRSGVKTVDEVIASLSDSQLLSLLLRVRDWNTNVRTVTVAQRVLNIIIRSYSQQRLASLGKRRGGKECMEALKVYTDRHYQRAEELWSESWLVEFLLLEMDQLGVKDAATNGHLTDGDADVFMV